MQKLLIVIAIQFCLPWAAYGIQQLTPEGWSWSLGFFTVFINTVCVGSMLGLMWPRWRWMLIAGGLLIGYWAIWQEFYFSKWRDYAIDPNNELRWYYLKFLFQTAAVSAGLGGLLSPWLQLGFKSEASDTNFFRFTLGDLLCCTALLGVLVVSTSIQFQPSNFFEHFLWLFEHPDAVLLIAVWAIFYLLLWPSLNCKVVATLVCAMACFIFALMPYQQIEYFSSNKQDYLISKLGFLYLALLTMVLYRGMGLRLVWRRPKLPAETLADGGTRSCKNC